jgi:uncharacterized protein YprB with RNaseH-like and TPR domain
MSTEPQIWCHRDRCHSFDKVNDQHVYCTPCNCRRKAENTRKRLTSPIEDDEQLWALQENRKLGRADSAVQKNEWILNNKKIVMFDLETFDLAADFGLIMVGCIKERGGETLTFQAHGDRDEREVVVAIRDALEDADYVVTYYGTKFDIPYLNTRLLLNGERPLHQIQHVDVYYTARFKLKLNRNRLQNLEEAFFGDEEGEGLKTRIKPGIWRRALQGSQDDLDYIIEHCQNDVILLEKVFDKLKGFINLGATRLRRYGASY